MNITVERMANTVNALRGGIAILWTALMFTVVSNASYGDGDVEWGFLLLCIIVEAVTTYGIRTMYHSYAIDKFYDMGISNHVQSWNQGIGIAIEDIRSAKLYRTYLGALFALWSFICSVICVGVWITV